MLPQVDGIYLSLLYEVILPKKQLQVDMGSWDPDAMLNDIKQTMQEEEDKLVGTRPTPSLCAQCRSFLSAFEAGCPVNPMLMPRYMSG